MLTQYYDYNDIIDSSNKHYAFWKRIQADNNEEKVKKWKANLNLLEESAKLSQAVIFLFDYANFYYFYVSENARKVTGYAPEEFYNNGVNLSVNLIHPDYVQPRLDMLHFYIKKTMEYPVEERKKLLITSDFMYRTAEGKHVRLVQQTKFMELDDDGKPLISLNYLHSFGSIKKEPAADIIVKPETGSGVMFCYDFEEKKILNNGKLSTREVEILQYLAKGLSTKQIAETLCISANTVNTHRKNLLEKTNCRDTSSLVLYAKISGLM